MPLAPSSMAQILRRILLRSAEALIIFYLALDALVAPLFRPLLRWLAQLRFVIRLEDFVASLPPYAILALLAAPFALAEPAKLYALILFATGHVIVGLVVFVLAYLVSFVIVERIYSAGRTKLRTILWFARLMDWLVGFRDRLIAWAKATQAWAFAVRIRRRGAEVARRLRLRFGLG